MNSSAATRRLPGHNRCSATCIWPLVAVLACACSGCWEEVPYHPSAHKPAPPAAEVAEQGSPTEPSPVTPDTPDPSAGELFGGDSASPPSGTSPLPVTPTDPSPIEAPPPVAVNPEPAQVEPTATVTKSVRRDAWIAASEWSLAAAVYAKGRGPDWYQKYLDEATRAAAALNLELPALPIVDDPANLESTVAATLEGEPAKKLAAAIGQRVDSAAGSAAQLAIQSHLLLLTYKPLGSDVAAAASAIRTAGEAAHLPEELWQPLVTVLYQRAEYSEVRKAVFTLQQAVAAHLAD